MTYRSIVAILAVAGLCIFLAYQADNSLHAAVPANMPASARFIQTGYDVSDNEALGRWVACRLDPVQSSDWCRVTDQAGYVVFEGQFLPLDSDTPVPESGLHFAKLDKDRLWTNGPTEQLPIPVLPLANGQVLVPVPDRGALIARWANDPEESQRYLSR
jgi:hypothetical protein